jgi:hypothetical protein
MAINIPIITEFADAGLKSAQGAFDTFRSKVAEAEGGMGKFKAGAGVALDTVKANAGMFAAAAGGAIAGFALNAINDFSDLALEVDKFRDSTNLTLDQSSRWKSYAGDLGIEADAMIKIFDKLGKGATDQIPAFEELGVEIAFGENGTVDIEETFFRVIDKLNSLEDPAARAKLQAELFGKGWMNAAEIINNSSSDIRSALTQVGDFEIIDEDEIQKAKDLRAAQDRLGDAIANLSIKLGEALIPALTAAVDTLSPLLELLGEVDVEVAKSAASEGALVKYAKVWEDLNAGPFKWLISPGGLTMITQDLRDVDDAAEDQAETVDKELVEAWKNGYRAMIDVPPALDDITDGFDDVSEAWNDLLGKINEEEAWNGLLDQLKEVQTKSYEALVSGTAEDLREAQDEANDLTRDIADYVSELGTVPPDVQTKIIAALERGAFDEAIALLNNIRSGATAVITGTVGGIPIGPGETPSEVRPGNRLSSGNVRIPVGGIGGVGKMSSVTINVGGSVIAERDLVETVRSGLVNAQRNGAGLVYTNR